MTTGRALWAGLRLLDRQLVTNDQLLGGCVDDLELTASEDGRDLYVTAIISGPGGLAYRIGALRLGRWLQQVHAAVAAPPRPEPNRIPFNLVADIGSHIELGCSADEVGPRQSNDGSVTTSSRTFREPAVRLSDLLRSEVVDTNGRSYGTIEDVLVVQDGPLMLPFGAAFRVDRFIVGTHRVGTRLGYNREGIRGPQILRALFGRSERRAQEIPWDAVIAWDGRTVQIDAAIIEEEDRLA